VVAPSGERIRGKAGMVFVAGKTVWSMPEHFKVVFIMQGPVYKCSALPFYLLEGVRMLRFYFWVLKGPNCTKNFWAPVPPILEILWIKGSTFPPPPKKLGGQIPSMFCTGYPRDDPQNPENLVKVSPLVSEIFGILLSEPMAEITWCLIP